MKTTVRYATLLDVASLVALWRRFMAEETAAVPDAQVPAADEGWTRRLREQIEASKILVAELDGVAIGFLGFIDSQDRAWVPYGIVYVVDIYVAPEGRSSAAARGLFRALAVRAGQGYSEIWTNTNRQNGRVRVLLTRAGFVPLDGFTIPGLEDDLYYRLSAEVLRRMGTRGT